MTTHNLPFLVSYATTPNSLRIAAYDDYYFYYYYYYYHTSITHCLMRLRSFFSPFPRLLLLLRS